MNLAQKFRGTHYHFSVQNPHHPPLVLLHGVGLDLRMWDAVVPPLRHRFAVLRYDFLGHGRSQLPEPEPDMECFVTQLRRLTEHLQLRRFALIGFSMGALIAQAFAARYPNRLTHLALLHSVAARTQSQQNSVRARYQACCQHGPQAVADAAIARWFTANFQRAHPDTVAAVKHQFSTQSKRGYLPAYRIFAHWDAEMTRYPLSQVACPALVLTGQDDPGATPRMSQSLAQQLARAQLIINPNHRHLSAVEFPEVLAAQLRAFLDQ